MPWGLVIAAIFWLGESAAAERVSVAEIHGAVERFVQTELATSLSPGERVEVKTRWQREVSLEKKGKVEFRVRRLSDRPLGGPTLLRVAIAVNGRVERELTLTAEIHRFRPALVARRLVRQGEGLSVDLIEVQEREITSLEQEFFGDPSQLRGMRARRPISPGEVITSLHVEPIPAVKRGKEVVLLAQGGGMQLTTLGVALEDGGVGEQIRVRNSDSGKVVRGEVVDARTVRVGR